jgi:hypothetical protein
MKKKMKKFAKGGFSAEQEEFLGGADRTDPYILARMRAAHPDTAPTVDDSPAGTSGYGEENETPFSEPKAVEKTVVKTKVTPTKKSEIVKEVSSKPEKKPYIDIPKDTAIGLRQFRSDGVSPMERLFKSISGKSQRTTAAEKNKMAKGGSVKSSSASKRGDGCAVRGKTKGRMV